MGTPSDSQRRLIDHLKRVDGATVAELGLELEITGPAVRQQLDELSASGLVAASAPVAGGGRGRPSARWSLTTEANDLFPDRNGDLAVDLIESIREVMGDDALDALVTARSRRQRKTYQAELGETPVELKVQGLARIRNDEGYLAEVTDNDDGSFSLTEHHCPICVAAATCQALCRDELETFQSLFSGQATVERTQHLLSGDQRCSYRITPRSAGREA